MSDDDNQDVAMAQCGACDSIIPLDSEVCQDCGVRIGGISEEVLGECGACGHRHTPAERDRCDQN